MGMAASQARLLSITSRMADNELRAQIVNNSKMRLATESSQASEAYVNALNDATMMFTNYDAAGNDQYQKLNFNNLTQYSSYNTQYGLTNAYGQLMISENEARLYKAANGDLNEYLKLHGLERDTNYFTAATFGAESFNLEYYDQEAAKTYNLGLYDVDTLKNMYYGLEGYEGYANNLSIAEDYAKRAETLQKAYNRLMVTDPAFQEVQNKIDDLVQNSSLSYDSLRASALALTNSLNGHLTFNRTKLEQLLNDAGFKNSPTFKLLNSNGYFLSYSNSNQYDYSDPANPVHVNNITGSGGFTGKQFWYTIEDVPETSTEDSFGIFKGADIANDSNYEEKPGDGYRRQITYDDTNYEFAYYTQNNGDASIYEVTNNFTEAFQLCLGCYKKDKNKICTFLLKDTNEDGKSDAPMNDKDIGADLMREFLKKNLMSCFEFDTSCLMSDPTLSDLSKFMNTYFGGDNKLYQNYDLSKLAFLLSLNEDNNAANDIPAFETNANLRAVKENFILDCLFDKFGEPTEGWLVMDNMEEDANPKVQWYTNIFEKIQKSGYAVLENGLASSNEWIQYALESGLVNIEQVDKKNAWNATLHSNVATITEVTDDVAVARAEAQYKKTMNDIENKDKRLDIELKNIDTEHNALQTEYESVKSVISKNIERSFKMYNA